MVFLHQFQRLLLAELHTEEAKEIVALIVLHTGLNQFHRNERCRLRLFYNAMDEEWLMFF